VIDAERGWFVADAAGAIRDALAADLQRDLLDRRVPTEVGWSGASKGKGKRGGLDTCGLNEVEGQKGET